MAQHATDAFGFAFANGKPVVLICAEPRGEREPYPFDIRHRHVISYATHSLSDFEKLREEVTSRLKAQVQRAEKLQAAVAMSQIKPTEGLSPHKIAVLFTILIGARSLDWMERHDASTPSAAAGE